MQALALALPQPHGVQHGVVVEQRLETRFEVRLHAKVQRIATQLESEAHSHPATFGVSQRFSEHIFRRANRGAAVLHERTCRAEILLVEIPARASEELVGRHGGSAPI